MKCIEWALALTHALEYEVATCECPQRYYHSRDIHRPLPLVTLAELIQRARITFHPYNERSLQPRKKMAAKRRLKVFRARTVKRWCWTKILTVTLREGFADRCIEASPSGRMQCAAAEVDA